MPDHQPGCRIIRDIKCPEPSSYQHLARIRAAQPGTLDAAALIPASEDATLRALGYEG